MESPKPSENCTPAGESEGKASLSIILDSAICEEVENQEDIPEGFPPGASSDSISDDSSDGGTSNNLIQNSLLNSLESDGHSKNGLVSSADSNLPSSSVPSETEGNDSNPKATTENISPEVSEVSNSSESIEHPECFKPNEEDPLTNPGCETVPLGKGSVEKVNDCDENISSSVTTCSTAALAEDLSEEGCSNTTNDTLNEVTPIDLSVAEEMDVSSSSESRESDKVELNDQSNNSGKDLIAEVCHKDDYLVAGTECSVGDNNSIDDDSADPDSKLKLNHTEVSCMDAEPTETKIDCALNVAVSLKKQLCEEQLYDKGEISSEPQDLTTELSRRKIVDSSVGSDALENHCDSKFPVVESLKLDKNSCVHVAHANNWNISVIKTESSENSSDKLASHVNSPQPTDTNETQASNEDSASAKILVSPKSCLANDISILSDNQVVKLENDHKDTDNTFCEAVDLTKAQVSSSVVSEQYSDCSENSSESIEKGATAISDSAPESVFHPLNKEETGFPDSFEGLVTIGKYVSVKGDFTLRSTEALIESPSLIAPFLLKEPDIFPVREQPLKIENRNFFQTSVGEFLVGLGLSRCNEWFYRDMIHMKNKQIKREGKLPLLEQDLKNLQSSYVQAKLANEPYVFTKKTCSFCSFSTESRIVLEGHLLAPHTNSRREYECNFCSFLHRDPKSVLNHMKLEHNKLGHIETPAHLHECPNCTFGCNTRMRLTSHLNRCAKHHDHATVQFPPKEFDYPCLTPKPITVAVVKAYEKSISCMQNRYKKPRKGESVLDTFQHHLNQLSDNSRVQLPLESNNNLVLSDWMPQVIPGLSRKSARPIHSSAFGGNMSHAHGNKHFQVSNNGAALYPNSAVVSSPLPVAFSPNASLPKGTTNQSFKGMFPPCLPQLPKLQGPYPVPADKSMPCINLPLQSNSLVVCEICDGYIKDMEQLRTHMQLIHKVKIHPKVLSSRPPLNCQKCQWRFFTDQGLERHLLGAHGLVTSNMQDMANKNKDSGCCTICGRVFASKLVVHMSQTHKVTLKPAHLSYKCTVCSATFNLYRLFENHVYLVHSSSSSVKRPADSSDLLPSKKVARGSSWDQLANRDKHSRYLAEKENGAA